MNRFDALLGAIQVGDSVVVTAADLGMDGKMFNGFVDSVLHVPQKNFRASDPHPDSDGPNRYDAVVITRTV